MNLETLAIEALDSRLSSSNVSGDSEQVAEITPMAVECFNLVGGGSSIVLFD